VGHVLPDHVHGNDCRLIALEQLPDVRQPTRNMADMKMLLNGLYPPPEASLHLTTARWRIIPGARPLGARDV
jgi:hypothetical protein